MKKARIISLAITLILCISIVGVAWVNQEATMNSIRITSKDDGVTVRIRLYNDDSQPLGNSVTVDATAMELKPCVYQDGGFYNRKGANVTNNEEYVRMIQLFVQPESKCTVRMTKTQEGSLPVHVMANDIEITDNTGIGSVSANGRIVELYFYIDGEEYTEPGTATIDLTLVGA